MRLHSSHPGGAGVDLSHTPIGAARGRECLNYSVLPVARIRRRCVSGWNSDAASLSNSMWMPTQPRSRACAAPPASAWYRCFWKTAMWSKSAGRDGDVWWARRRGVVMHEISIAMSILDMAEEEAGRRSVEVDVIHVRLGALSGVAKQALLSAYDLARSETTLETAQLVIEEVPVMIYCPPCRAPRGV